LIIHLGDSEISVKSQRNETRQIIYLFMNEIIY